MQRHRTLPALVRAEKWPKANQPMAGCWVLRPQPVWVGAAASTAHPRGTRRMQRRFQRCLRQRRARCDATGLHTRLHTMTTGNALGRGCGRRQECDEDHQSHGVGSCRSPTSGAFSPKQNPAAGAVTRSCFHRRLHVRSHASEPFGSTEIRGSGTHCSRRCWLLAEFRTHRLQRGRGRYYGDRCVGCRVR